MIDKGLYKDKKLSSKEKKKIKPVKQAGGMNYLGKQKTVTVPKKWLSSPDHVVAELAYITPREQKILIDANIYGSLKGKPNKGPGGIMSLQGDLGGYDASPGGPDRPGGGRDREAPPSVRSRSTPSEFQKAKKRAKDIMTGKIETKTTTPYRGPQPTDRIGPDKKGDFVYRPTPIQRAIDFAKKIPTPINIASKVASGIGDLLNLNEINRNFYEDKVVPAGRTDLDYEDYMQERLAGNIDAYGNPLSRDRDDNTGVAGVASVDQLSTITPKTNTLGLVPSLNQKATAPRTTSLLEEFNYGTASNPIFYKDLV